MQILLAAGIGIAAGGIFAFLITEREKIISLFQGMCAGGLLGIVINILEKVLFDRVRKVTVYAGVLLKTVLYSLVFVVAYLGTDIAFFGVEALMEDIGIYLLPSYIMTFTGAFILILGSNVNKLLGQKALLRIFFGKYHTPVIEKRIFMFLDLESSTTIAEEIGDIRFHLFLNEFFFDITGPVIDSGGEIYKYVGDEMIVSWTMNKGLSQNGCIECFFLIDETIRSLSKKYTARFGRVPKFGAGLHCGEVVVGEIGDYKREVAFLGDAVNTTSRIQAECKKTGKRLIVSDTLKNEFSAENTAGYVFESFGSIALRGKKKEIELFGVTRNLA